MALIDRDVTLERMKSMAGCATCDNYNGVRCRACIWDDAMNIVEEMLEVNAMSVIRCRDCKYWNETIEGCGECERLEVIDSNPEIIHAHQTPWDWYCADGERRDSNGTGCELGM